MFGSLPQKQRDDIQFSPEIPGNPQKYPEIPESKKDTRKYPIVFSTLLPDPNPTCYPVFFPIPDPILKNPTRWALPGGSHIYHNAYSPGKKYFFLENRQNNLFYKIVHLFHKL